MRGVDIAFQRLQPITLTLVTADRHFFVGQLENPGAGKLGHRLLVTHIDPDDAIPLGARVSFGVHLVFEILMRRHVRHIEAIAFGIEFPAVVDAADAALFVTRPKNNDAQRCGQR